MNQSPFTFDAGSATHPGKVRPRNEDSHLVRTDAGLWAVADGMGGHEAGDVASQLIVKRTRHHPRRRLRSSSFLKKPKAGYFSQIARLSK